MKEKFLWNTHKTLSVRASRIRNFSIDEKNHSVTAWVNNTETLRMGEFESADEARNYLEKLHAQIEGIDE